MTVTIGRRELLVALGGAAAAWPLAAHAQQPAMPSVGVMSPLSLATAARNLAALRNRLRELGYAEGRNINIEYRFGDGLAERFPVLVADLVALKPAVIVVGSTAGILAEEELAALLIDLRERRAQLLAEAPIEKPHVH